MSTRYVRRPRRGDALLTGLGIVTVRAVRQRGRQLVVRDRLGRDWPLSRAEHGTWVRAEVAK